MGGRGFGHHRDRDVRPYRLGVGEMVDQLQTIRSPLPDQPTDRESAMTRRPRRASHRIRLIALAVGLTVGPVIYAIAKAPAATESQARSPLVGHPAPKIAERTITDRAFNLATLRGHFVVVDFFASWCVPCRTEQPELVKFAKEQARVRLVGVIFGDSLGNIRAMLGGWIGLYPVLNDPNGQLAINYGVDNPPSKYLIDPAGKVVAKFIGPVTAAALDLLITRAQLARG